MMTFSQPIPLTLYIHIPWCVRKCPYCDFNSHALKNDLPEEAYINALIADLEQELPHVWGRRIQSIFIGGGTPSLFSPKAIENLLRQIQARLPFSSPDIEITLEANPGTVEQERFAGFRAAGINRLSLGVQSFNNRHLEKLGRIHDSEAAITAVKAAKQAGFHNINIDLMYGLPQQTKAEALDDLAQGIALETTHLSWYQLTIEPNTLFHQHPPKLPEDEMIWDMQLEGQNFLANNGMQQYEVSAYSKNNYQCAHNRNYWEFGDYLGIGAGAHGKITDVATQQIKRIVKAKHPKDYLTKNFIVENKIIKKEEIAFEFMLNALRLKEPIALQLFTERTGLTVDNISHVLNQAEKMEFLHIDKEYIHVTTQGWHYLNNLMMMFL